LKWNLDAQAKRTTKRVFCASMADVFELRRDLDPWRERLWDVIGETPWLNWLLLTKRPQNIGRMVPWRTAWPENVWLGTSVEDQSRANERMPLLLKHPSKCRFVSCEPLVGAVDLTIWIDRRAQGLHRIDWVIAGGESGHGARPMYPGWARRLRDQCAKASVPFHFKQWGHWAPVPKSRLNANSSISRFWDEVSEEEILMEPKGKHGAGRHLDGVTWDELPATV
jgi:protein gp37